MYDMDPNKVAANAEKGEKKLMYVAWEKKARGMTIPSSPREAMRQYPYENPNMKLTDLVAPSEADWDN